MVIEGIRLEIETCVVVGIAVAVGSNTDMEVVDGGTERHGIK